MTGGRHFALGAMVGVLVLAIDQASKAWVQYGIDLGASGPLVLLPVLDLVMVGNRGVTFGLLTGLGAGAAAWSQIVLSAVALAVVAALCVWLRRAESRLTAIAIGAIAGGAVGNVADRLRLGHVVDFIHAHVTIGGQDWSWYVFNLADTAIVCGVIVLVLEGLIRPRSHLASATRRD